MTVAIVAAAGEGRRLGVNSPKAFVRLGNRPMMSYSIGVLNAMREIDAIFLSVPDGWEKRAERIVSGEGFGKVRVMAGGVKRADTVARALDHVPPEAAWILVHDGARPFLSAALVRDVLKAARAKSAAAPMLPVTETVKRLRRGAVESVDREGLVRIQTPQVFRADVLRGALRKKRVGDFTDETTLIEATGGAVAYVPGDPANVKVTTAEELKFARRVIGCFFKDKS